MNALQQLTQKISRGLPLTGDDIIALLLLLTMVASLSHLLTMLATRWGDRNVAFKSLLGSVLIHCVCFLGLEVFDPISARAARADAPPPPVPETVTEVLVESDQTVVLPESGNMPIADRPVQPEIELERFEQPSPEITTPELPERARDELESLTTAVDDVTQFEQRDMTELAVPTEAGETGPKQPAAEDPFSELDTSYEQSRANVFTPELSRTKPESGRPAETREDIQPDVQLTAPEMQLELPRDSVAISAATDSDSAIVLPPVTDDPGETIQRRTAPMLDANITDGTAVASNASQPRANAGSSFQSRLPRPSRSAPDRNPADRPSRETPNRAMTPTPLSTDYDDVRIGDLAPSFSDAIASAAPLVESDLPTIRRRDNPPANYQLRNVDIRRDAAERFGGTRESETAVERSLRWLAAQQSADGRWDASDFGSGKVEFDENGVDRKFAGREADTGVTALVVLAFLGAGYTHEDGKYALEVDRALNWLIEQQGKDGNLCGNAEHYARMYCHAMATYALAEAFGMQRGTFLGPIVDPSLVQNPRTVAELAAAQVSAAVTSQPLLLLPAFDDGTRRVESDQYVYALRKVDDIQLRGALSRAVAFTIGQQDPESGGWRYKLLQEGDVSMFGWQMMSLKSAEIAGVSVPGKVRTRMNEFLNSVRQGEKGGLFGYRRNVTQSGRDSEPPSPTMTAEALFCQQMLGYPRDSESNQESIAYLMRNLPRMSKLNYYYWYYGTLAMYQHGGRPWEDWNTIVRDVLISEQVQEGPNAGSWDPNDEWGRYGGRLYSTALATLTLEVYYRLLPLYRMNDVKKDEKKGER